MRKLMIITSLMFSSIIVSNACIDDFNDDYNEAESQYNRALAFCNKNFIFVQSSDDYIAGNLHIWNIVRI